jgi:hypothetical protein
MAYGRRKFWLHQCQPTIPQNKVPVGYRLVQRPELATLLARSESNIYWRMRGRQLKELGVLRYFKHGGRWWFLIPEDLNHDYFGHSGIHP